MSSINTCLSLREAVARSVRTHSAVRLVMLVGEARVVALVHVAVVLLDKAFLADAALKPSELQVAPYVVFHVAELLGAMSALETEEPLVFAASLRVDEGALRVLGLQIGFHVLVCFLGVVFWVKIC